MHWTFLLVNLEKQFKIVAIDIQFYIVLNIIISLC